MRSDIVPGTAFPDYELSDHTSKRRKLSELQGAPDDLALSQGLSKDRHQAEGLVQFHRELEVGYCGLVTISDGQHPGDERIPHRRRRYWPFCPTRTHGSKGPRHRRIHRADAQPDDPHVIVLEPGLVIYKIYNGYWFFGRPTLKNFARTCAR